MKIIIVGGGLMGVTSAWYLLQDGHEVIVLDKHNSGGRETSFANGGQISVGQAEPWANPAAPAKLIRWLGKNDAPLLFRPCLDTKQWSWAVKFLMECLPNRTYKNTKQCLVLANYSRNKLRALRESTDIKYDDLQKGILTVHTDEKEFDLARERVDMFKNYGVEIQVKNLQEIFKLEPALKSSEVPIIGGTYAPEDESGDAFSFTQKLADLAKKQGAVFGFGVQALRLLSEGNNITGLETKVGERKEKLTADAYVIASGCNSRFLMKSIGVDIPVYPVKGYSVTVPLANPDAAPHVCITDENAKIAISRLGGRIRAAGTAELSGYDLNVREERCIAIINRLKRHFPEIGGFENVSRWAGLRPAVPNNLPLIGKTKLSNLFINTGQGTLGWTLACGSAAGLANVIGGQTQEIDYPFLDNC